MPKLTDYWYGLKKDGTQVRATDEEVMRYARDTNPMSLTLLWGDETIELNDGTRLAKTKAGAEKMGWNDIAKAPFSPERKE
jgi:hypothetical protein